MAQMHRRKTPRLPERLGLRGGRTAILACVAIAAVLCGAGLVFAARRGQSFGIERGDGAGSLVSSDVGEAASGKQTTRGAGENGDADGSAKGVRRDKAAIVVHVDGAVVSPGVFELESDAPRLRDAVDAAGGLAEDADTSGLNLAEHVSDGQKVHVPTFGEGESAADGGMRSDVASGGKGTPSSSTASRLVNINTASAEELQGLSGVGEATARAIVEDRANNGPFSSPEDLMRVSGIGEKKFARLRGSICV